VTRYPDLPLPGRHHEVVTPGDILVHVRASRRDLCVELATLITARFGKTVCAVDEVHGFNYFNDRVLISG